jgi:hypothetical protein
MKNRILLIVISFITLFSFQCKKGDDGAGLVPDAPTITDNIKTIQENGDNLITSLLAVKDTATALDSVLKVILKDINVLSGEVTSQGISIKYKNGIIGGILINPEDGVSLEGDQKGMVPLIPLNKSSYTPTSKKTIFVNPSYTSRQSQANQILNLYNIIFPRAGYNPPVKLLDNAATIDAMTNLAGYGVVHIYSHGWAYPKKRNITEVYLMTGETVNATTNKKYENELTSGNIPVIKVHKGDTKYFISPAFFSSKNNFLKDSTKIYGGFCFSFMGGWPGAMEYISQAGSYSGFTWRVETNWNAALARSLMDTLTNNTLKEPRTLDFWFTQTPTIAKQMWDAGDQVWCKIQYSGHSDLTLWTASNINISPNPAQGKPNEIVKFTAKSTGKLPAQSKYRWNFGDGSAEQTVVNDSTVTHSYILEGNFAVSVKLLDQTDKQVATANAQAIISAVKVTPDFNRISYRVAVRVTDSWTAAGKYIIWGDDLILRDTSYSGEGETGFVTDVSTAIVMNGNTFSGGETKTDPYGNVSTYAIGGSYEPVSNTISASYTYSYNGVGITSYYILVTNASSSVNGLPAWDTSGSEYSFGATGFDACNYTSNLSSHSVDTPNPPYGVTQPGIKFTHNASNFFCTNVAPYNSEATVTLSRK